MYSVIKSVITSGDFELCSMLNKLDTFWVKNTLTDEQYKELVELARQNANEDVSIDVLEKLKELDTRVTALETNKKPDTPTDEYPEFVVGKWYKTGDKITFEGKQYTCIVPDGQVCVYSPVEYPAYWTEVI